MSISKTTVNYAAKRSIDFDIDVDDETGMVMLWICKANKNADPIFCLFANTDGSFSWKSNVSLPQDVKEEIPAYYENEKVLRKMLDFLSTVIRPISVMA